MERQGEGMEKKGKMQTPPARIPVGARDPNDNNEASVKSQSAVEAVCDDASSNCLSS